MLSFLDEQPPYISCPSNKEQPTDFGEVTASLSLHVEVADNVAQGPVHCADQDGLTITVDVFRLMSIPTSRRRRTSGSSHLFTYGHNSYHCEADDHVGNTAFCYFTVNILGK